MPLGAKGDASYQVNRITARLEHLNKRMNAEGATAEVKAATQPLIDSLTARLTKLTGEAPAAVK